MTPARAVNDNGSFKNDNVHQIYKEWLKNQSKDNIKTMVDIFMAALINSFNLTTVGIGNVVGILQQFEYDVNISTTIKVPLCNRSR